MLMMIALQSYSTTALITDTIPTPTEQAMRNALRAKDSLEIMIRERNDLLILKTKYEQLDIKDSLLIASLDKNIALADKLIVNLEKQVTNSEKQGSNKDLILNEKDKIIKKKNRTIAKLWAGLAAVVIGGVYMISK